MFKQSQEKETKIYLTQNCIIVHQVLEICEFDFVCCMNYRPVIIGYYNNSSITKLSISFIKLNSNWLINDDKHRKKSQWHHISHRTEKFHFRNTDYINVNELNEFLSCVSPVLTYSIWSMLHFFFFSFLLSTWIRIVFGNS